MPALTRPPETLDARLRHDHETRRLWRSARPFPTAEATAMPRPSPATVYCISGLLLGPWQGFGSHVHTGPAAALCRDGRSRGGSSKGSGGGGLLRSSS